MIPRRRSRFDELVRRQLDLFAEDVQDLLEEVVEAERAYDEAQRGEAEEAYGDFQTLLDAVAEALSDRKTTYAATLEDDAASEYERAFDAVAGKRFPLLRGRL